ncbi:hypothetical protein AAE478_008166 [Parahypoxylon ruwenzoriense]
MAPHKGHPKPTKAASGHAKKKQQQPTAAAAPPRPIVLPAIPLPMMAKQQPPKPNQSIPTVASSNGVPASSLEAALADHVPASDAAKALQPPKISENEVNGSNVEKPEHAMTANSNGFDTLAVADGMNGTNDASRHMSSVPSIADAESIIGSAIAPVDHNYPGAHDAPQYVSQPQSATSPTRPDLRPSFHPPAHPLQHQLPADQLPDSANLHGLPHLHHYRHHHHMSNGGGIMFGGFAGSHTPSPVPLPGGFMPPPPPPVNGENHMHRRANGHHHVHSNGNGFPGPINTQFRPEMMPPPSLDTYGQGPSSVPPPPFDPFSPGVGRYGLSTPQSFHGSHGSGEPNSVENGAMPFPLSNGLPFGGHGHHEHPVGHPHPAAHFPPFMHPEVFARHPGIIDDGLRDSIAYFQDQFDTGELTDCVLELVSTKGLHHPVKITGHKLILARSPALKQHIMAARATDLGAHTITIESEDPYLRSDAWWNAVRRLYLYPLLTPTVVDECVGDKVDRFEFCLGYAAAGHLLNMHDVFLRGLQMAADFITWNTVEAALGFVFEGMLQRHVSYEMDQDVDLDFGYGPDTKFLLEDIMNFLINAFPSNFELDTSVGDPPKLSRIPHVATAISPPTINATPTIVRGTNVRNPTKSNRLSNIKFGDLPPAFPEDGAALQRGPAKCSPILSRILLNLPFYELCAVLTSVSDGVSGWNTAQGRYHAVADVVAEREARRLRAAEAIRTGTVPHSQEIQQRLSAQRRYSIVEPWDVLNWQEEVVQPRGAEVPAIVRRWVPQFSALPDAPQHQLQPQLYDAHNSMV